MLYFSNLIYHSPLLTHVCVKKNSSDRDGKETDERVSRQSQREACLRASEAFEQRTAPLQVKAVREARLRAS